MRELVTYPSGREQATTFAFGYQKTKAAHLILHRAAIEAQRHSHRGAVGYRCKKRGDTRIEPGGDLRCLVSFARQHHVSGTQPVFTGAQAETGFGPLDGLHWFVHYGCASPSRI